MSKQLSNDPGAAIPGVIMTVPLNQILADQSKNSRRFPPDPKKLKFLQKDLSVRGQLFPLLVIERNGQVTDESPQVYELTDGFRRYAALQAAADEGNIMDALVRVMPDLDAVEAYKTSIAANNPMLREEPSLMDQAYQVVELKAKGMTGKEIAAETGIGGSMVSQIQKMVELRPEVQKLIHTGEIGLRLARVLPELDEADQDKAIARAQKAKEVGESVSEIAEEAQGESRKKKGKGKAKQGRKAKDEAGAGKKGPSLKAALNAFEDAAKEPTEMDEETGKEIAVRETKSQETRRLVFGVVYKFLAGKLGAQAMVNQIGKLI